MNETKLAEAPKLTEEQIKAKEEAEKFHKNLNDLKAEMSKLAENFNICFTTVVHFRDHDVTGIEMFGCKNNIEEGGLIRNFEQRFKDA